MHLLARRFSLFSGAPTLFPCGAERVQFRHPLQHHPHAGFTTVELPLESPIILAVSKAT
jgi:hypothetical protein